MQQQKVKVTVWQHNKMVTTYRQGYMITPDIAVVQLLARRWSITHVHSGRTFGFYGTKQAAIKKALRIANSGLYFGRYLEAKERQLYLARDTNPLAKTLYDAYQDVCYY